MDYVLINDNCDSCRYVSNAFSLLSIALKILPPEDFFQHDAMLADATVMVCKNIEDQDRKLVQTIIHKNNCFLISFQNPDNYNSNIKIPVHFLKLPFSKYQLKEALNLSHQHKNDFLEFENFSSTIFERLIGHSAQITKIKDMIKQVSYSDTTVLILGQSGTGKDVIASCIHQLSNRKVNPFVPINCGAIPSELIESELFGHEKGAFTGAAAKRSGRFEMANSGTLFLDEIGDMPLPMQVKLLRVIQERIIERVGGNVSVKVDVRLIAATNKNLEELIQTKSFREDLFYRLNVFPIQVPSLAERHEDIPLLIDFHLDKIAERLKHRVLFTDSAKEILSQYAWPGNIRELQNFLERMVILYPDRVLNENTLEIQQKMKKDASPISLDEPFNIKEYIADIEQQMIKSALDKADGAVHLAAKYLSLGRTTLIEKMKKYNLVSENN